MSTVWCGEAFGSFHMRPIVVLGAFEITEYIKSNLILQEVTLSGLFPHMQPLVATMEMPDGREEDNPQHDFTKHRSAQANLLTLRD